MLAALGGGRRFRSNAVRARTDIVSPQVPACAVAAFVATTCESWLGASVQGNVAWLTNEVINFINTLIGAAVAAALVVGRV